MMSEGPCLLSVCIVRVYCPCVGSVQPGHARILALHGCAAVFGCSRVRQEVTSISEDDQFESHVRKDNVA